MMIKIFEHPVEYIIFMVVSELKKNEEEVRIGLNNKLFKNF